MEKQDKCCECRWITSQGNGYKCSISGQFIHPAAIDRPCSVDVAAVDREIKLVSDHLGELRSFRDRVARRYRDRR